MNRPRTYMYDGNAAFDLFNMFDEIDGPINATSEIIVPTPNPTGNPPTKFKCDFAMYMSPCVGLGHLGLGAFKSWVDVHRYNKLAVRQKEADNFVRQDRG